MTDAGGFLSEYSYGSSLGFWRGFSIPFSPFEQTRFLSKARSCHPRQGSFGCRGVLKWRYVGHVFTSACVLVAGFGTYLEDAKYKRSQGGGLQWSEATNASRGFVMLLFVDKDLLLLLPIPPCYVTQGICMSLFSFSLEVIISKYLNRGQRGSGARMSARKPGSGVSSSVGSEGSVGSVGSVDVDC